MDRGIAVNGALLWMLVAIGLTVVVVRRRSVAVALVTAQALVLVGFALYDAKDAADVVAAAALGLRAVALAALFLLLVSRTRELRPVHARVPPLVRAGAAITLALILTWLVPVIGLDSRNAERAVLARGVRARHLGDEAGDALPCSASCSSNRLALASTRGPAARR